MKTKTINKRFLALYALCALLCSTFGAFAQEEKTRELVQEDDKKPASQKRVALVIGNAATL